MAVGVVAYDFVYYLLACLCVWEINPTKRKYIWLGAHVSLLTSYVGGRNFPKHSECLSPSWAREPFESLFGTYPPGQTESCLSRLEGL